MIVKRVLPTILVIVLIFGVGFFVFRSQVTKPQVGVVLPQTQAFLLPISEPNYYPVRNFNIEDPKIDSKAAGVYDIGSEKFLFSQNIEEKLPIASVTKLMTATVIVENLDLDEIYTVTPEDVNVVGKGADLSVGEKILGRDLFKIMLIKSSNDAALTFARAASAKSIDLIERMNAKANAIDMLDTKFTDPAGLDDGNSYSTVSDLVKLVRYVDRYPIIWETLRNQSADVSSVDGRYKHHVIATNQLLGKIPNIIGGKTGYTDGALDTMVLEVAINGGWDKIITVVLGSHDRFGQTKALIDWSERAFKWR